MASRWCIVLIVRIHGYRNQEDRSRIGPSYFYSQWLTCIIVLLIPATLDFSGSLGFQTGEEEGAGTLPPESTVRIPLIRSYCCQLVHLNCSCLWDNGQKKGVDMLNNMMCLGCDYKMNQGEYVWKLGDSLGYVLVLPCLGSTNQTILIIIS